MPKHHRATSPLPRPGQSNFLDRDTGAAADRTRVMVALYDTMVAARICAYLDREDEFSLVQPWSDRQLPPQVVVLDFSRESGLLWVQGAAQARPVALASVCDDDAYIIALQGGAWALLPSHPSPFEVTAVVRQVASGECPILSQIARRPTLAASVHSRLRGAAPEPSPLSLREAAILTEVSRGAKNSVIAALLGLQEQTIKNYLSEILRKTGTGNRAEAAALAVRQGWLPTG